MPKKVTSKKGMGGAWENLVSEECRQLRGALICNVSKNHEDEKVIPGSHVRRSASKPDFSGFFMPGASKYKLMPGLHVVFDAKSTDQASLPLSNIADHQRTHLDEANEAGAVAFLYVHKERDGSKWVFPMWYVEEMSMLRSSVPFEHETFRKQPGEHFVAAVERIMRVGEWVF